jgi:protocatechuate 3,4-dioxygenase beta subunit
MKKLQMVFIFFVSILQIGCGQSTNQANPNTPKTSKPIGGKCDGCDAIYDCLVPFEQLSWIDTLPDFSEQGPKMVISGVIYMQDGKTPAPGVVLYVYHTDQTGHYTPRPEQKGNARRHGYIRGWMRTNAKGEYKFYTLKPAAYPNARIPAHIHPILIEPGKNDYYIDEYRFQGDPFLTPDEIKREEGRGGSGIITLQMKNGMLWGERNIYLGRNIPDYSISLPPGANSGLAMGKNCAASEAKAKM